MRARVAGFTLIEMVFAMVITGVLAAAAAPAAINAFKEYESARAERETLDKLRYALERMAREIRETKYVSGTGYSINMSSTAPAFTKNGPTYGTTDPTVTISQSGSLVQMAYSSSTLATAPTLTDQLNSLSFAYYTSAGVSTASASDVKYVEIDLSLANGTRIYAERTRVGLRNQ